MLDLTGERAALLRPGGVPAEAIEAVLGGPCIAPAPGREAPRGPGMLASALRAGLAAAPGRDGGGTGRGAARLRAGARRPGGRSPEPARDRRPAEAASRLFAGLRWLDAEGARLGLRGIAVMPVPETGLGIAINDRLRGQRRREITNPAIK